MPGLVLITALFVLLNSILKINILYEYSYRFVFGVFKFDCIHEHVKGPHKGSTFYSLSSNTESILKFKFLSFCATKKYIRKPQLVQKRSYRSSKRQTCKFCCHRKSFNLGRRFLEVRFCLSFVPVRFQQILHHERRRLAVHGYLLFKPFS